MVQGRQRYTNEEKEKILKEVKETGNKALVARTHNIHYQTIISWVRADCKSAVRRSKTDTKKVLQENKQLKAMYKDARLENEILKELLKKTNQVWLTEKPSLNLL